MPSTAPSTTCKLLELPAELRNRIYRYSLCAENPVEVPRAGLEQPSLNRTCKQIRKEATAIYYLENTFGLPAPGFERYTCEHFERQAYAHVDTGKLDYLIDDLDTTDYSWSELVKWLKAYHDGKTTTWDLNRIEGPNNPHNPDNYWYIAAKASEMVGKVMGKPEWDDITNVLETCREATIEIMERVE